MSAPHPPNQPPPVAPLPMQPQSGPFAAPEPTIAIAPGAKPAIDNADATQVVSGHNQPEATQVVRPGTPPSGGVPPVDATLALPPGAPVMPTGPQIPQPQIYGTGAPVYPQAPPQPYGQQPPGYPQQPSGGFGQQLGQAPGYPPQQPPGYPPQQSGGYGYPQAAPYQYGAAHHYASWGQRALAGLIDYLVIGVIALVLILTGVSFAIVALVQLLNLVNVFYNICYLGGVKGQTLGKQAAGIKLVRQDTGLPVGFGLAFGRAVLHIVDALPIYIGFFAPLWDERRQTFADKIVDTVVVVAPKAVAGYPAPQPYGQPPRQW